MRRVRLSSSFYDAGEVNVSLITGGEAVLERMEYELPIHGLERDNMEIQRKLEKTLCDPQQLTTWVMLESNRTRGFEDMYNYIRKTNGVYKVSLGLASEYFVPITARIFTPYYILNQIRPTQNTKPMLDFFVDYFSQEILYENDRPLILMMIYYVRPDLHSDATPRFYCNSNSLHFLQEIGLNQYAEKMYSFHYTDMRKILYQMGTRERNEMFRLCGFSTRDRAHFSGLCEEYANLIGQPIGLFY